MSLVNGKATKQPTEQAADNFCTTFLSLPRELRPKIVALGYTTEIA